MCWKFCKTEKLEGISVRTQSRDIVSWTPGSVLHPVLREKKKLRKPLYYPDRTEALISLSLH